MFWGARKSLLFWALLGIAMRVALPFAGILMPKLVIDALLLGEGVRPFLVTVLPMAAALVVLNFWKSYTDVNIDSTFSGIGIDVLMRYFSTKRMTMDYELTEDPDTKKIEDKAFSGTRNNHTPMCNHLATVSTLTANALGLILYGSVIAMIHPLIVALLVLTSLINWFALWRARKYEEKTREYRSRLEGRARYVFDRLINRALAKDMRLYSMSDWLMGFSGSLIGSVDAAQDKVAARDMLAQWTDGLLILLRDGAAYAFLVHLLLAGRMELGDFALSFAAIGAFAGWVSGVLVDTSDLMRANTQVSDFRTYIDLPDRSNTGPGAPLPVPDSAPGIRFEGVSYTYPGAAGPALEGIDVYIQPGERIAIVGANGAGKTTLVKLLCGLYRPQKGRILLEDTDITLFNRDEYFTFFSAVFQDIHLLADSIAANVSQRTPEETDRVRVERCLKLAGLYDRAQSAPEGMDTLLVRQVHTDAQELSGGELQKLALARALYKDAPIIVLDEPTAALDPIAENEMYKQYAALTQGKTSLYISHRLASTRFCDRILFLDDHRIAEQGTHDELMRLGGRYAHMFSVQASYYAKEYGEGGTVDA